jgi:uncharacterized protein
MSMIITISVIMLILDAYAFKSLFFYTKDYSSFIKTIMFSVFWLIPLAIITSAFYVSFKAQTIPYDELDYRVFFAVFGAVILFYVPKVFFNSFQIIEDLLSGLNYLIDKFIFHNHFQRYTFITKIAFYFAVAIFIYIGQGILFGKYNYKTTNTVIKYEKLPESFEGFKIVQLSDIHIGSLRNKAKVEKAIESINKLRPDIILFTGDLVNNLAKEMDGWEEIFAKLDAKYGKYSVLGNHDYGDYIDWPTEMDKKQNVLNVIEKHEMAGFKLLMNNSVPISDGIDTIYICGVENWGLPPFHQYGDLNEALIDIPKEAFKVLLSHDPSHWDAEVLPQTDIDLTLSGHTHGMQAGINFLGLKWSPVKYKYPRWSGLYKEEDQYLYVNQGFGFIGFPGRIGMPPEITVIELKAK